MDRHERFGSTFIWSFLIILLGNERGVSKDTDSVEKYQGGTNT